MLSAYAAEQIKKLNHSTDNVRFSADTYLRAAGENAETPEDKAAFAVLSGALSMAYDAQEDCYTPDARVERRSEVLWYGGSGRARYCDYRRGSSPF